MKSIKNAANDAEVICEAVGCPQMRFAPRSRSRGPREEKHRRGRDGRQIGLGPYRPEYLNDSHLWSGSGAEAGAYVIVTAGE
jgi:hypothetical protein